MPSRHELDKYLRKMINSITLVIFINDKTNSCVEKKDAFTQINTSKKIIKSIYRHLII